jgi:RCR-type E3 ubiquitin transferase
MNFFYFHQEKLGNEWALAAKSAVLECVLNMTKLEEKYKNPSDCLKSPTFWLAISTLCILNTDVVEKYV